ncbi:MULTISPECIES: SGNH/GDSL hydrolase family protein [unclassified Bacillus (in: firmicutes)]|uniref:SGNH/GDSL hydrolase family protein n=1 Tax=unclassified Bacillus (in: firmicutes) TaxID=185979 RepID=UPI001BE5226D|nr:MULTISPECIES: SGNH/GDSL hydrolase family protein [unclassified Bacillus (in: firmicutes)]MBT2616764.1 SGNH/GDSL hydrolase family protein [Bacillus sp. ISL-78]MBT2631482.1 SGNH/GDSL hydrolase family protein [Bacillus sp. ISL-101]
MKVIIPTLIVLACVVSLVIGNIHWNGKISDASVSQTEPKSTKEKTSNSNPDNEELVKYIGNWPQASKELYKKRLAEGKPFKILMVGSNSLGNEEYNLPDDIADQLKDIYGDTVQVDGLLYDLMSSQFVLQNKQKDLIEAKADLILFEPFTLKDNGNVSIEDSLDNITTIIEGVTAANKETQFILQPPNPLYNATYYPNQVKELERYANDKDIPYLNHWSNWPDQASDKMKDVLNEQRELPNEKGYKIWSLYLEEFFIKQF